MKIKDSIPELQINKSHRNLLGVLGPFPPKQNVRCLIDLPTQWSANLRLSVVSSARTAEIFQHLQPAEESYELQKKGRVWNSHKIAIGPAKKDREYSLLEPF